MKKLMILVTILLIIICTSLYFFFKQESVTKTLPEGDTFHTQVEYLKCNFYNDEDFKKSVLQASGTQIPGASIRGGITPHHLLASKLIASLIKTLSVSDPEVVVVIAPNHKGFGVKNVQTSDWDWQTPFGVLKTDTDAVAILTKTEIAGSNPTLMEDEHSISGLVPYIKYYMPKAKIFPILIHGTYNLQNCRQLGETIHDMMKDKKYVVIASIDFSHYLTLEKADMMDEETMKAISNWDLEKIRSMGNDNLDSPPSLITFLAAMNADSAIKSKLLVHSNSARIMTTDPKSTTSYFTMVFYKG